MKRIFLTAITFALFSIAATAQDTAMKFAKVPTSKEEKEKMKAKQEAELTAALSETGLTDVQTQQVRAALTEASQKSNELKNKTGLDDVARDAEKQKINQDKNARLKEIMGKEKYSQWNAIRKRQKEVVKPDAPVVPITKPTGN